MFFAGVFKGTYGPHGIELINLTYQKSPTEDGSLILEGSKLTGDPNVPFREVSFRADLSRPVFYTNVEDQVQQEGGQPVLARGPTSL